MRFLIRTQTKDSFYALPPDTRWELAEGGIAFIEKYRKAGKCKDIYYTPDLTGTISIWEVNSGEEAARIHLENPQRVFTDFEIDSIVEWDAGMKALMEYRDRMKAAAPK